MLRRFASVMFVAAVLVLNLLEDEQLSADALKEIQKRIEEGR